MTSDVAAIAGTPETSLDRRVKRELRDGTWLSDKKRRHDHQLHVESEMV